jgi:diaminohydroxyphosphoribosylaminopyrimidine deaminase/5-amino-6-(5-phosphoribosylamino)uracil reductase
VVEGDRDAFFMARALALAERGRGRTSPNPMVGAVLVDDEGVVVGRGYHEFAGGPHAEIHALRDAGERAGGATMSSHARTSAARAPAHLGSSTLACVAS